MKLGIVGGGAAGMMAAVTAAEKGFEVTILEHGNRIGKKLLLTGNGKCNLTNINQEIEHYHSSTGTIADTDSPWLAQKVFHTCSYTDTLAFFTRLGIYTKNRNGGLYPYSEQAASVLEVLRMQLRHLSVNIITDCQIKRIKKKNHFLVETSLGKFEFDKLIIAAGSAAAEQTGSDGSGYQLAEAFGHHIICPLPALVQLRSKESYFKQLAGIRTEAVVTVCCDGKQLRAERGELQLTNYGLSGIPIFQLSYLAARALKQGQTVNVLIDFMPDLKTVADMEACLKNRIRNCPDKYAEEFLIGMLHKNLNLLIMKLAGIKNDRKAATISSSEVTTIAAYIKAFSVPVSATNSFKEAQVCCGGIDTEELTENLESKLVSGLYFAGEIIDVNGDCGGYNLQWAWSSGMVAGRLLND